MSRKFSTLLILLVTILLLGCPAPEEKTDDGTPTVDEATGGNLAASASSCNIQTGQLPTVPASFDTQEQVDIFSWETLGAIAGQWTDWYTTVDMICAEKDQRFVPSACQGQTGSNRVLQQVGKVNDSFLEATVGGLSGNPVIDQNGNFLRYEIFPYYPNTYNWLVDTGLNKAVNAQVQFPCPDDPNSPSMTVKLAWMDAGECGGSGPSDIYTEDLLIFDPPDTTASGDASCNCRKMALVGIHIAQKTVNQGGWIWSTFEHKNNAPDCQPASANMPAPTAPDAGTGKNSPGPNTACPTSASGSYHLYGDCPACTSSCNTPPTKTSADTCGDNKDDWCIDVARDTSGTAGTVSKLCRQVGFAEYYDGATSWDDTPGNKACQSQAPGVWSNYQLISSQWLSPDTTSCDNISASFGADNGISGTVNGVTTNVVPTVTIPKNDTGGTTQRPFLANTTMESYERANCLSCHAKAETSEGSYSTDFVYFLALEVPEAPYCSY